MPIVLDSDTSIPETAIAIINDGGVRIAYFEGDELPKMPEPPPPPDWDRFINSAEDLFFIAIAGLTNPVAKVASNAFMIEVSKRQDIDTQRIKTLWNKVFASNVFSVQQQAAINAKAIECNIPLRIQNGILIDA